LGGAVEVDIAPNTGHRTQKGGPFFLAASRRDNEGNDADASKLVGTKVRVVSEHAKIDSIGQIA